MYNYARMFVSQMQTGSLRSQERFSLFPTGDADLGRGRGDSEDG